MCMFLGEQYHPDLEIWCRWQSKWVVQLSRARKELAAASAGHDHLSVSQSDLKHRRSHHHIYSGHWLSRLYLRTSDPNHHQSIESRKIIKSAFILAKALSQCLDDDCCKFINIQYNILPRFKARHRGHDTACLHDGIGSVGSLRGSLTMEGRCQDRKT